MSEQPEAGSTSISAAAHVYQQAMSQQTVQNATAEVGEGSGEAIKDGLPTQSTSDTPISPAPAAVNPASAPSPVPLRTSTPFRSMNGNEGSSRAASQHPDPSPSLPTEAPLHGAPTRQYLNSKVTATVLEGMKQLAKEQPRDPLRVLGEFLLQRSKEIEGI